MFPAWQSWADDLESVLQFLLDVGRLPAFTATIQRVRSPRDRDALLAEVRGTFVLHRQGFRVLEWEPRGEGTTRGEALVALGPEMPVFVEVKHPSWEGEHLPLYRAEQRRLSDSDRAARLARMKLPRFLPSACEGGPVGSHYFSMSVVRRNALPKLSTRHPNLVVVVDDCQVTPVGLPTLSHCVLEEFAHPAHDPLDPEDRFTYERLGGILFIHPESFIGRGVQYDVDFIVNPGVLSCCALPPRVIAALEALRDETNEREAARYGESHGFLAELSDE